MTYATMKPEPTANSTAGSAQGDHQRTQVTSPAFASVHGAAQAAVVVVRKS